MLENYFPDNASSEQKQRVIAVNAALELIKVTLADSNDGNSVSHQLQAAERHIESLADAIQKAVKIQWLKENCILQHVWTCEAEHTGGTTINKQSVYLLSVPFFIWNDRRALK